MNNNRITFLLSYLLIAALTMFTLVAIMRPLIALPLSCLFVDGLMQGILLAVLCFFLKDIVRYGKYTTLPFVQRVVNYGALAILFLICWIGLGAWFLYLVYSQNEIVLFLPTLPLRIVIGLLVYAVIIFFYEYSFCRKQHADIIVHVEEEPASQPEEVLPLPNAESEQHADHEIMEHIAVKNGQKIDLVFVNEVICIQAEGDYVMIYSTKGKFLKEQTMKYFNDHLPPNKFVRVHRSSIVNIDFIQRIELYEKQNQVLKLQNNLQVKMSIAGYRELKKVLNL